MSECGRLIGDFVQRPSDLIGQGGIPGRKGSAPLVDRPCTDEGRDHRRAVAHPGQRQGSGSCAKTFSRRAESIHDGPRPG